MKKLAYMISNVGLVLGVIWTLILGVFFILLNPLNADAFYFYSYLLMIIVMKIYLKKVNINNILNIVGLMILNIGTIIIPLTVLYILGIKIGGVFFEGITLISTSEINMKYIEFLTTIITRGSFGNPFLPLFFIMCLPLFFIICFVSILFSIEYLRLKNKMYH